MVVERVTTLEILGQPFLRISGLAGGPVVVTGRTARIISRIIAIADRIDAAQFGRVSCDYAGASLKLRLEETVEDGR